MRLLFLSPGGSPRVSQGACPSPQVHPAQGQLDEGGGADSEAPQVTNTT